MDGVIVVGLQQRGLTKRFHSLGRLVELHRHAAELEMGVGVLRVELDRLG